MLKILKKKTVPAHPLLYIPGIFCQRETFLSLYPAVKNLLHILVVNSDGRP